MTNLVVKKSSKEKIGETYLSLLSQGYDEESSRKKALALIPSNRPMVEILGVPLFGIAGLITSAKYLPQLMASSFFQGWTTDSVIYLISFFVFSISITWTWFAIKRINYKFSAEGFLTVLNEEERTKATEYLDQYNKVSALMKEYRTDEEKFLLEHFGSCSKEMLYDAAKIVERDKRKILCLIDKESEEHKKIKPALKLKV